MKKVRIDFEIKPLEFETIKELERQTGLKINDVEIGKKFSDKIAKHNFKNKK